MVIELGHTAIAEGAVLGANRSMNDACVTELAEVECVTFRQIEYHLQVISLPLTQHNRSFL